MDPRWYKHDEREPEEQDMEVECRAVRRVRKSEKSQRQQTDNIVECRSDDSPETEKIQDNIRVEEDVEIL